MGRIAARIETARGLDDAIVLLGRSSGWQRMSPSSILPCAGIAQRASDTSAIVEGRG
jgi:hypothetical protein